MPKAQCLRPCAVDFVPLTYLGPTPIITRHHMLSMAHHNRCNY